MENQKFINLTLEILNQSIQNGNHPFGALLVLDNKVVLTSENKVNSNQDITTHAEPCAMCAGAIYWAGIKNIVYGCSAKELFSITNYGLYTSNVEIYEKSSHPVESKQFGKSNQFIMQHTSYWNKEK